MHDLPFPRLGIATVDRGSVQAENSLCSLQMLMDILRLLRIPMHVVDPVHRSVLSARQHDHGVSFIPEMRCQYAAHEPGAAGEDDLLFHDPHH